MTMIALVSLAILLGTLLSELDIHASDAGKV
jgi:hypothetical protein